MKTITLNWNTEDILELSKTIDIRLNELEADEILERLDRQHDASIGINWEVIRSYIYQFEDERQYTKRKELMNYPFEEGDDYWTIENGNITWSCWDYISEELHDKEPNKMYFTTEQHAHDYLKQLN
jgi:hypothetical protein